MADVPPPAMQKGRILVRTAASLISAGTERTTVELGKRSLLGKARERPDLVQQVIQKARTEGLRNTLNAVRAKLDSKVALGYSAAGLVVEIGEEASDLQNGDRVACAGAGFASHAEVISVPKNLCVRVPDNVGFDEGAFGTLGAIALQGVRLADPTLGEAVVVIGLGLIGQLTVQLLRANGCRVFGVDPDKQRADLALLLGAEQCGPPDDETREMIAAWSRGRGADAVLITAATQSNEPLELAGEISRLKGRVVAVGLVGLDVPRNIFYHKELTLKISMSYGPGRYDPEYEERGHDYPFGYVRWTEARNIEAFLDLVASGQINVERLITHRFGIDEANRAYSLITGETSEPYLGVVLRYDTDRQLARRISLSTRAEPAAEGTVRIGLIGAGSYAKRMLLPNFKAERAEFQTIATASGVSAREIGEKYGFRYCVSDADEVIGDSGVNLIVIATRHDTHAELVRRALLSGHHVFVEKPLALNESELRAVLETTALSKGQLMVGFNRRFSPLARAAKDFFQFRQTPLSIVYRINAGRIPRTHWIQDPLQGGRIIGEVCHFIDLMQFLTGAQPVSVYGAAIGAGNDDLIAEDSVLITLRFADGSNGSIAYLAEGDKGLAKERVEIFGEGRAFVIDDFRDAKSYSNGKERHITSRGQDKGQAVEVRSVCDWVIAGGSPPIALEELESTTRATFCVRESLRTGKVIGI
ncbi:MAG TPA: bi-domain-containing oxidoreductase [Pyrinomonadaceae bacterium]|nr:bi-domain-containing oxidoreductase [Pyrinomonadaceae bacterium]